VAIFDNGGGLDYHFPKRTFIDSLTLI